MNKIDEGEIRIARSSMEKALEKGADKVRVTLNKSVLDLIGTLNGEIDNVSHCLDRSLQLNLFVDGRYGAFSTNRLDDADLDKFISQAISTTRMLEEDKYRKLPDPARKADSAHSGTELDLYDSRYEDMTSRMREEIALGASIFNGADMISEEAEYSDSIMDILVIDSEGLECRHTETSFEYGSTITIKDGNGNKYDATWWDSSTRLDDLDIKGCSSKAFELARRKIGPKGIDSGKYNMVVDSESAQKLVTPLLNALNAFSIHQNNSFLKDSLGKKIFSEGLTLIDEPHIPRESGSKLFDSEGVATSTAPIIEGGVIKQYFINTYMAGKMGMEPTLEDPQRPVLKPFPKSGLDLDRILRICGDGILVTGFNGGNSNSATGDFSYGVEGFAFKDGKITHPVREMLVTGNYITLWNSLIAAGSDSRRCKSKLIPTLAFSNIDFSA